MGRPRGFGTNISSSFDSGAWIGSLGLGVGSGRRSFRADDIGRVKLCANGGRNACDWHRKHTKVLRVSVGRRETAMLGCSISNCDMRKL